MLRPVHFEIQVDDPARAIAFYTGLFGWQIHQAMPDPMPYWLIRTGEEGTRGIDGGLLRRQCPTPVTEGSPMIAFACTIDVPDIDAYIAKALAGGGSIALPKMPIPGVGWLVYIKDTEHNVFGMMQNTPDAK